MFQKQKITVKLRTDEEIKIGVRSSFLIRPNANDMRLVIRKKITPFTKLKKTIASSCAGILNSRILSLMTTYLYACDIRMPKGSVKKNSK